MTLLRLPFPPSVNNLFMNVGKRRIRTPRYDAWRVEAAQAIKDQSPDPIHGPYRMVLTAIRPDRRARDLDNLTKACADALKTAGVIRDDSDAMEIILRWSPHAPHKPGFVLIALEAS